MTNIETDRCDRCGRTLEEWPCNGDGTDWVDKSGQTFPVTDDRGKLVMGYAPITTDPESD